MSIILVDPMASSSMLFTALRMQYPGADIEVFKNALDARKAIVLRGADLLYTKIEMPHYSGYELATMTKKRNHNVGVYFISADGSEVIR